MAEIHQAGAETEAEAEANPSISKRLVFKCFTALTHMNNLVSHYVKIIIAVFGHEADTTVLP